MQVELVRWPAEETRLAEIRVAGHARLVMVPEGVAPPLTTDPLEDCQTDLWLLTHPESRHLRRVSTVFAHLSRELLLD